MKTLLSAVVGATLALAAIEVGAQTTLGQRQVALEIESKTLAEALDQWAQQSGYQIFVENWSLAKRLTAPTIKGTFTAQAGLAELLKGTPLTYVWLNDKAVAIREKAQTAGWQTIESTQGPRAVAKLSGDSSGEVRPGGDQTGAGRGGDDARTSGVTGTSSNRSTVEPPEKPEEEIIVTGTHIRGVQNKTVPVTVLDKAYINSTGVTTTTRLMETLPQNFGFNNQSVVSLPPASGATDPAPQASSITLRGLGQGTTLILLNGHRIAPGYRSGAVDISALPLTAIERVEIITDGASALYGSDAVGGVVNFILREDFEGAETRVSSGWADGVDEYRLSQVVGSAWDSGNAVLSLGYYKRDLLRADDRDFVPSTSLIGSLLPEDENYSAVFSGKQHVGGAVELFADALYTQRDSVNLGGPIILNRRTVVDNPQLAATAGFDWSVGEDWHLETAASYAKNSMDDVIEASTPIADQTTVVSSQFEIEAIQLKADGSLFKLPGGDVRAAVGGEWRSESYKDRAVLRASGALSSNVHSDQIVRSAFVEMYVPIFGTNNARAGFRALELSLAGRYDDYSNFGSSVDPQFGVMLEPIAGLRLRASHGTSYKAPNLADFSYSDTLALSAFAPDPGAPGGTSNRLQVIGTDVANLSSQESESTSVGLEIKPSGTPGLQLGLSYYHIEYTGRIAAPTFINTMLGDPAFALLFTRDPSLAQIDEVLAAAQRGRGLLNLIPGGFSPDVIDVIVDLRKRNLSVTRTSGLDVFLQYAVSSSVGDFNFGVAGTHIYERVERVVSTSPEIETVGTIYNPPDWRARGSFGWANQGWSTNLFVNYTDSYVDNRTATAVPISSHTTVDARLAYDFGERFRSGFLSGMTLSANVQNAFDRDPPHTAVFPASFDMGFDPTNASPLGRLIVLELSKSW